MHELMLVSQVLKSVVDELQGMIVGAESNELNAKQAGIEHAEMYWKHKKHGIVAAMLRVESAYEKTVDKIEREEKLMEGVYNV